MNERMAKMRGYRDMIGGGLRGSLLLGVSTMALLAGLTSCDWFDGNTPVSSKQIRPGADQAVVASGLPSASSGRQYDSSVAPIDETRTGPQIGSIVAGKGGQKAQQEAMAKESASRDAKARVETDRLDAERKAADATAQAAKSPPSSSSAVTQAAVPPPAAVTTTAVPPPVETATAAPPPASPPVTTTAVPPVAEPTPASAVVAAAPTRPADPNKAFEPPPGWVPPGRSAPVVTANTPAPTLPPASTATVAPPPVEIASAPPPPLAPSPPVTSASIAPPPTAAAAEPPQVAAPPVVVASAPARRVDPNKAFEPPAGWVPPGRSAPIETASAPAMQTQPSPSQPVVTRAQVVAPPPPVTVARQGAGDSSIPSSASDRPGFARPTDVAVAAPPPVPVPEPVAPPAVVPAVPPPPVVVETAAPLAPPPPAPPVNVQADIARAQSGSVPFSAISNPPGGPLQVAVIQFGRASSGLGGRDSEILRKVAQIARKNGGTVRVVAHADQDVTGASAGQIERGNYDVSRRRALAIANQLMALGVPRSAIVAEAASDAEPLYATNTARGIAANRRAEIFLDL